MNFLKKINKYYFATLILFLMQISTSTTLAKELDIKIMPSIITIEANSSKQPITTGITLINSSSRDSVELAIGISPFIVSKTGHIEYPKKISGETPSLVKDISITDGEESLTKIILSPKQEKKIYLKIKSINKDTYISENNFSIVFSSIKSSADKTTSNPFPEVSAQAYIEFSVPVYVFLTNSVRLNSLITLQDFTLNPIQYKNILDSKIVISNQNSSNVLIDTNISIYNIFNKKISGNTISKNIIAPKTTRDILIGKQNNESSRNIELNGLLPGVYKVNFKLYSKDILLTNIDKTFIYLEAKSSIMMLLVIIVIRLIIIRVKKINL